MSTGTLLLGLGMLIGAAQPRAHTSLRLLSPTMGVGIVALHHPVTAIVRVAWEDPTGRESCPAFAMDWANGRTEGWVPHCDPYAPHGEPTRTVWLPKEVQYWMPGEYKLVATVTSMGERHSARVTLTIVGLENR